MKTLSDRYDYKSMETLSDRRQDTCITKVCMKSYDGKHFQTVDRQDTCITKVCMKSYDGKLSDRRQDTCITKVCMKSYDGKHFQTVDRTRALQKSV